MKKYEMGVLINYLSGIICNINNLKIIRPAQHHLDENYRVSN